jgi:hypothetical protein
MELLREKLVSAIYLLHWESPFVTSGIKHHEGNSRRKRQLPE